MARPATLLVLLFFCALGVAADDLARARALYQQKEFHAAAEAFLIHLDRNPDDYDALLLLGLSLQQSGDSAQAEKAFAEAVRRREDDPNAHLFLARALYLQGRHDAALESLRRAADHGAPPHRVQYQRGLILTEKAELEAALGAFLAAGELLDARLRAATTLLDLNRPEEALDELAEAEPSAERSYQMARAQVALGDHAAAIASLSGVEDHPEAASLRVRLEALPQESRRSVDQAAPPSGVTFEDVSEDSGIDFVLNHNPTPEKHLPETMAGGLALFDGDGDGLLDIFFTNGAQTPTLEKQDGHANRLYRNLGDFRFEDITERAGLAGEGFSIGAAAADFDNDGDTDLFVAGVRRNLLYRNLGDGRFEEISHEAGIGQDHWSVAAAWFDYDGDGLLDLFVANYLEWDAASAPECKDARSGVRTYCHPKFFETSTNKLYRNRGDGTFEDVSDMSGIDSAPGKAMSVALSDVDQDGDLDIFVPNDALPNTLFLNDGQGRFEEAALEAGVALKDDGIPVSSMGAVFGDVDGDRREDLVFTALTGETFPHFRNQGDGYFLDQTASSGVGPLSRRLSGWGVALADFNNDGRLDIFTANAHVMDNVERFSADQYRRPNALWINQGDGVFLEPEKPTGLEAQPAAHRGLAVADLDQDGRLDAIVTVLGARPEVWRNTSPVKGCPVSVSLRGTKVNRDAIGAVVQMAGQVRTKTTAVGYASSVNAPLHFARPNCSIPYRLMLVWGKSIPVDYQIRPNQKRILISESPVNQ